MACEVLTSPLSPTSRPAGGLATSARPSVMLAIGARPSGSLAANASPSAMLEADASPEADDLCRSYDFEQLETAQAQGGFGTYSFGSPFFGNLATA